MTKKEWSSVWVGTKVQMDWPDIDRETFLPIPKTYYGTIIRLNSNRSQVLVKFDDGHEVWKGRTGIELQK